MAWYLVKHREQQAYRPIVKLRPTGGSPRAICGTQNVTGTSLSSIAYGPVSYYATDVTENEGG